MHSQDTFGYDPNVGKYEHYADTTQIIMVNVSVQNGFLYSKP